MIAPELVNELQRLNREEKLEVIRLLNDDLSDDIDKQFEGARVFKMGHRFIASDGGAALKRVLEEDKAKRD
ncbi:MAG: hypothetical protein OXG85_09770 [Chloroflexi bacterium]|nr:hypothetical protein [Chloroflexota bacterium]